MPQLRVLVAGASIAGPMTAYWLAKAGAHVTVIERYPELRSGGQNVDIRTCGVTVMRRVAGMEAAVRARLAPLKGISFVRERDGSSYGTIGATGDPDQQSIVSEFEIFRGDLARVLYDLTKDDGNVRYVFGEQVASITQDQGDGGSVTVEFANGKLPPSQFDLVVAADGATSRTRAIGLGCGVRDHFVPTNCWAAYYSVPHDFLNGSKVGQACSSPGGRFLAIGPDHQPNTNRITLMGINPRGSGGHAANVAFREAQKHNGDKLKHFVANHFRDAGWEAERAIRVPLQSDKPEEQAMDFYASEIVQIKLPALYKGRFVLVGDAGYAAGPTGGGTSLAMAGAYVLAGEVAAHPGNLQAGLRAYEERMRPIIDELQKMPPGVPAVMAPQTARGIWFRNMVFQFITWSGVLETAEKYWGAATANADQFALPEYEFARR